MTTVDPGEEEWSTPVSHPGESPTDVALRFVREELAALRATFHDEISAIRTDFAGLSATVVEQTNKVTPKIAVLEHRVDEHDKDIAEVRQARADEAAAKESFRRQRNLAIAIAAISALVTIAGLILTLTLGD